MPFFKTKPVETKGADGVVKERKKAPTQAERFEALKADILANIKDETVKMEIETVWATIIGNHVKTKSAGGARGIFYQIFNHVREADGTLTATATPTVGLEISPAECMELTEGKGAITDSMTKRWATEGKGVPYGKGSTAIVKFYRRVKLSDGTMREGFYRLEEYTAKVQEKDSLDSDNSADIDLN